MTEPKDLPYRIAGRELVMQADGVRVQILTLGHGKGIPWHHHSIVTDTFVCLEGTTVVETKNPDARYELSPGQHCVVLPGTDHEVTAKNAEGCKFTIVQGVGEHDFILTDG